MLLYTLCASSASQSSFQARSNAQVDVSRDLHDDVAGTSSLAQLIRYLSDCTDLFLEDSRNRIVQPVAGVRAVSLITCAADAD